MSAGLLLAKLNPGLPVSSKFDLVCIFHLILESICIIHPRSWITLTKCLGAIIILGLTTQYFSLKGTRLTGTLPWRTLWRRINAFHPASICRKHSTFTSRWLISISPNTQILTKLNLFFQNPSLNFMNRAHVKVPCEGKESGLDHNNSKSSCY